MDVEYRVVIRNCKFKQWVTKHHAFVANRPTDTQVAGAKIPGRYYFVPNADGCSWDQRQFAAEL
jgi:hypothetical protein